MEEDQVIRLPFYARFALVLLSVVLVLLLMHEAKTIIIPLFFSVLIAFMVLPVTKWFERRRLPRGLSAILSILIFLILIAGLISFLTQQISDFSKDLPLLGQRLQEWTRELQTWVSRNYHVNYTGADLLPGLQRLYCLDDLCIHLYFFYSHAPVTAQKIRHLPVLFKVS
jgi:predicted PurR-regulated permease PerM